MGIVSELVVLGKIILTFFCGNSILRRFVQPAREILHAR
jgi:hypothetical protein